MRASSAPPARASPGLGGGAAKLARSASIEAKSRSELRHMRVRRGSKTWFSMRSTISGSKGSVSPVVPKVPSFMLRPARPAICASSAAVRSRGARPSNLRLSAKATWSSCRLRPMPMASVATR